MATKGDRSVFVDTNVLLTATTPSRALHRKALEVLNAWPLQGVRLLLSGQVLREYLSVATRPAHLNGLGLSPVDALDNAAAFQARARLVAEDEATFRRLTEMARKVECRGGMVHDANIVAAALIHRADSIVTENIADLERFGEWIEVVDLSTASV